MQDVIEQEISINASLERVWDLVTEPGWWVPTETGPAPDRTPGSTTLRVSEKYGSFPVQVVDVKPRTYAAFRWASQFPNTELTPTHATLVEFFVSEAEAGDGVLVKVRESGFAALDAPEEIRQAGVRDNTEGWRLELGDLKARSEATAA
jgi:uncharacterized protein YndB with AHSA1/START domain